MNWREWASLSVVFAALTALGLWFFPGHTFLTSDTQIYVPLFEHLQDHRLLNNDLILSGAHLSFTIYDEVTLALSSSLGLNLETALFLQQFFFRWVGYWGAYLLARACGMSQGAGVLTSALLWLGAFVYGPAVLTTEYEPVPRGFAVPLVVGCFGALAMGWRWFAAILVTVAFLYHAPAVWPVLLVALYLRDWRILSSVGVGAVLLWISSHSQQGIVEAQPFFSLLDATHRKIQQLRAPYNWISSWPWRWWAQFLITGPLALVAARRAALPIAIRPYFFALPILGLLMMPVSYLLLEQLGWALFPQIQPMRALLFCHLLCQWAGFIAAWREIREGNWLKAAGWTIIPLCLALRGDFLDFRWNEAILMALIFASVWLATHWPRREWAWVASFSVALLFGEVFAARSYKPLETKPLDGLSVWAQEKTPIDSVFLFGDLGRRIEPGIFRARAERAVYVCWKQGGQVNYFPRYAEIWWERWSQLLAPGHPPLNYDNLRARGIDYIVFTKDIPSADLQAVYVSPEYRVYSLKR
ncbi:hypothetical protein [Bryobacter aggregatus]|uniref:hypothetical protein n=1 Tax=Bryobacter aggregatus TaxID=360054 RepID=UPI0004E18714|nr:hypothetical protein [Bryobacter aggregatus]